MLKSLVDFVHQRLITDIHSHQSVVASSDFAAFLLNFYEFATSRLPRLFHVELSIDRQTDLVSILNSTMAMLVLRLARCQDEGREAISVALLPLVHFLAYKLAFRLKNMRSRHSSHRSIRLSLAILTKQMANRRADISSLTEGQTNVFIDSLLNRLATSPSRADRLAIVELIDTIVTSQHRQTSSKPAVLAERLFAVEWKMNGGVETPVDLLLKMIDDEV